jgi:RimJ/RimL family protein N-acetyltransferase
MSPETPTVETARLRLRPWREEDLDPYAEMCADPEVMRYIGSGRPLDREESWRQIAIFIGHWQLRGYGLWAVERREDGSFIGRVGLWQPEGWPGLEIGWSLARPHWGHGYATEAGRVSREFAWESVGADELISLIQPENAASRRVAERLGMQPQRRQLLGTDEVLVYRASRERGPSN